MTIQAATARVSFVCNGVSTVFPVNIQAYNATDFLVLATNITGAALSGISAGASVTLVLNSHYTLATSGSLSPTFWTLTTAIAYPTGIDLLVILNPVQTQLSQYTQGQAFPSLAVQTNLDRLTQMVQRLQDQFNRSVLAPDGDVNPLLALPAAALRANLAPFFDASGNLTVGLLTSSALTQALFNTFLAANTSYTASQANLVTLNQGLNDADQIETVCQALEAGTATNIATFGDSTMWGAIAGPLTQAATPPYLQMQGAINNFFGNSACTAVNFAISGTTLAQMLAGADGSGLTYAARLASTTAPIVFMNHGQNDAAGGGGLQTTAAVYRSNLLACIQQTRAVGKTLIFVTPHPSLTIGTFGSQFRAEQVSRFRDIMLDVAAMHGVRVVDNFKWLRQLMGQLQTVAQANINLPLTVLPDGVHGVQATYTFTGNNLCDAILHGMADGFTGPDQRILATRPFAQATGQIFGSSTSSYGNASVVANNAGGTGTQSIRITFRTEATGLDISIMHPIYSALAGGVTINLDGTAVGTTFSQVASGFTVANYLQDVETTIARNIAPGWHQLTITTAGPGALSINGLRSRATNRPIMLGNTSQDMSQRQLISPKIQVQAGASGNAIVMTDYAVSRFIEALELEWTGQMVKNSQVVCAANTGSPSGSAATERMIGFGLNGSGFAQINEATAPGTYTIPAALDAVDHSAASHTYRVILTNANPGTIQMFVDDVSVGTQALTQPFLGGWLGVWKNLNTDALTLTNISRVWHF